jgi:3-phenylpropionate/cinnamic acid dioxygenase small subunit
MSPNTAVDPATTSDGPLVGLEQWYSVSQFLFHEAELLDHERQREWLDLLADDIAYRVPIRITQERSAGPGFQSDGFHMDEDKGMLITRVERLETEYAWAEDPPSRMRRIVSNIRAWSVQASDELLVISNLLAYRSRHDSTAYDLIAGERRDLLRPNDDSFLIAKREILLDQSTLGTHNLAIFL